MEVIHELDKTMVCVKHHREGGYCLLLRETLKETSLI